eukprot:gene30411-39653_t
MRGRLVTTGTGRLNKKPTAKSSASPAPEPSEEPTAAVEFMQAPSYSPATDSEDTDETAADPSASPIRVSVPPPSAKPVRSPTPPPVVDPPTIEFLPEPVSDPVSEPVKKPLKKTPSPQPAEAPATAADERPATTTATTAVPTAAPQAGQADVGLGTSASPSSSEDTAYTGSDSEDGLSASSSSGYWGILTFLLLLGALGLAAARYLGRSAGFSYAQVPQLDDDVGLQLLPPSTSRQAGRDDAGLDDDDDAWDDIDTSDIEQHRQREQGQQEDELAKAIRLSLAESQTLVSPSPSPATPAPPPPPAQKKAPSPSAGAAASSSSVESLRKKSIDRGSSGLGLGLAGAEPLKKEKEKAKEKGSDDIFASIGIEAHPKFAPPVRLGQPTIPPPPGSSKKGPAKAAAESEQWDKELDDLIDLE